MKINITPFIWVALPLAWASRGSAQLSVSSLAEYQLGNLPGEEPENLSSLYAKMDLAYYHNSAVIGLRGEKFQSSEQDRSYQHLAQRFFEWGGGPVRVRLGHFYSTLGRGLVLRAFELPNVIFEHRSFRRRYAYLRDLDGIQVRGQWDAFEFIALRGQPLNNKLPPQLENLEARLGVVEGGQVSARPFRWLEIGDAYLRYSRIGRPLQEMNSLFSQLKLGKMAQRIGLGAASLNVYAEHARINSGISDFLFHDYIQPHATFISLNLSGRRIGFTAEFKEYRDFETGINLPPIGYREHSYYLLNRSTHELLAENEKGHQFELSLRPGESLFLVLHQSRAISDFSFDRFEFSDAFIDATVDWSDRLATRLFFDKAKDEIKLIAGQVTAGLEVEWSFYREYGLIAELQGQRVKSDPDFWDVKYHNQYASITFTRAPGLSIAFAIERSDDPGETDDPYTPAVERDAVDWLSSTVSCDINMNHQVSLFAGSRRGGLVCVSGTCFEVLAFEGVELRWIARL